MKPQPPVIIQDFSKGIHTNYDDGLLPPNILRYSVNMYNDAGNGKIGRLVSRTGLKGYGTMYMNGGSYSGGATISSTAQIVGMYSWNVGNNENMLIAAIDSPVKRTFYCDPYAPAPPGWKTLGATDFGTGTVRFETFAGYLIAVSPNVAVDRNALSGAWGTNYVNGVTGLGKSLNIVKAFQGKLYLASDSDSSSAIGSSNTVYFSPQVLTAAWSTDYSFTLTGGNDNRITGLEVNGNLLLIFKPDGIYTWDGFQTQAAPQYGVGAINQEVIKTIGTKTIFAGQNKEYVSVYMYEGGKPVDISEPVREYLKINNLARSDVPREFGAWVDKENYCLSIYDVTIEGTLYRNVVLIYNTEKGTWTTAQINTSDDTNVVGNYFKFSANHLEVNSISPSTPFLLPDTGGIWKDRKTIIGGTRLYDVSSSASIGLATVEWGYRYSDTDLATSTDNISPISDGYSNSIKILIESHELDFGSKSRMKQLNKFDVFADGNYGIATVSYRIDGGKWQDLGQLTGKKTTFEPGIQFMKLELRISGTLKNKPFILESIEIFDWSIEDYET